MFHTTRLVCSVSEVTLSQGFNPLVGEFKTPVLETRDYTVNLVTIIEPQANGTSKTSVYYELTNSDGALIETCSTSQEAEQAVERYMVKKYNLVKVEMDMGPFPWFGLRLQGFGKLENFGDEDSRVISALTFSDSVGEHEPSNNGKPLSATALCVIADFQEKEKGDESMFVTAFVKSPELEALQTLVPRGFKVIE